MEKNLATYIIGYVVTAIWIHSFIPSKPKVSRRKAVALGYRCGDGNREWYAGGLLGCAFRLVSKESRKTWVIQVATRFVPALHRSPVIMSIEIQDPETRSFCKQLLSPVSKPYEAAREEFRWFSGLV